MSIFPVFRFPSERMTNTRLHFLSLEELLEMKENDEEFMLVEALAPDEYRTGHLPGAVNLPLDQVEAKASEVLPKKDAKLVVYCGSYKCHSSTKTARKLIDMGYAHVFDFKGGKKLWTDNGLDLQK